MVVGGGRNEERGWGGSLGWVGVVGGWDEETWAPGAPGLGPALPAACGTLASHVNLSRSLSMVFQSKGSDFMISKSFPNYYIS